MVGAATDAPLNSGTTSLTITLPGADHKKVAITYSGLPTDVCAGDVYAIMGCVPIGAGTGEIPEEDAVRCHLYLVDAAPTGRLTMPWAEVLDKSCDYANGNTGETDVRRYTTMGLATSSVSLEGRTAYWSQPPGVDTALVQGVY